MTTVQEIQDMLSAEQEKEKASALSTTQSAELQTEEDDSDKLKKLFLTRKELNRIKEDLKKMVDVMADNPSFFTRASKYWGAIPLWQKIMGGILIVAPTLTLGIVFNIHLLIAVTVFTLVTYVASSIVLDNHYLHISDTTTGLKNGITGLAEVLGTVIQSLETLHQELSNLVEAFQQENEKLSAKVGELGNQITLLDKEILQLQTTASDLLTTKVNLEELVSRLSKKIEENLQLLEANQLQFNKVQVDYKKSQVKLSKIIAELEQEKDQLRSENLKAGEIHQTLLGNIRDLTKIVGIDKDAREACIVKFTNFINDKNTTFNQIADQYKETGSGLEAVKDELKKQVARFKELIAKQEQQIERFEKAQQARTYGAPGSENESPLYGVGMFDHARKGDKDHHLQTETHGENPTVGGLH